MAVAKYKVRRGTSGPWFSWDGDMLHLPIEVDSGAGTTVTSIVGTAPTTLSETDFDNLVTTITANMVQNIVIPLEAIANNAGAVADVQAFLDEVTVHTD